MERGLVFAVILLFAIEGYCSFETDAGNDELSKRATIQAKAVFRKLKSSFLKLASKGTKKGPRLSGSSKNDIVFVMDKSGSIGSANFNLEKRFVAELIEYFPVFPARTRVAVVSYSTQVKLEFNFKKYLNKECTRKGIQNIKYTRGLTATGNALQYVRSSLMFSSGAGARSDAKKIIFVLTDGKSNIGVKPSIPANLLKGSGVTIYALGITSNIKLSELLSIASGSSHVFHLKDYAALNQVTRLLRGDRKCFTGQKVYDECGRRCTCLAGRLVKCCRLRKEFTDMTYTERVRYINTVKTASTHATYKTRYEQLLTVHKTIFFSNIHELDFFLPWHRWFILQYENLLREIDCRVTVPYWDWSLVGANPFSSDVWNTGPQGFGGNGNPSCVTTGPFRQSVWSLIASAGGGCLRRNFNGAAPDAIAVKELISMNSAVSQFINFEVLLRVQFHDAVHCRIDGTMCSLDSASAPEFFLHHGFIDKIWWDWQKLSNAHKFNTYFMTQPGQMPSTGYRSRDFLDLNNQPDCVCAEYVPPKSSIYRSIQAMSRAKLRAIPRLPLPSLSTKADRLFRTKPADRKQVLALRKVISPKRKLLKSSLKGKDALRGFKEKDITAAGLTRIDVIRIRVKQRHGGSKLPSHPFIKSIQKRETPIFNHNNF